MTRSVVVCAGLLVLASCGVSVGPQELPEITYYHLNVPAPEPSADPIELDVAVMPFSQNAALDRDGVHYRKSDVEGGFWEHHRWAAPVESMVRAAVQRDLDGSGQLRVVLLEQAGYAGAIINGEVVRFDEEDGKDGWVAVVEVDFDVTRRAEDAEEVDRVVLSRRYRREEPVAGRTVPEVVRALSRATGALLAEFREDLVEVLR